ncbi:MAG: RNA polymerase sigma-70 factor [Niabella sp.]
MLLRNNLYGPEELRHVQLLIAKEDEAAFASLYAFFKKRLVAFSFSLVRAAEVAEEVVEDVFIKLWLRRQTLPEVENLAVYLYVSVKNASLNRLSQKARQMLTQPFDDFESDIKINSTDPYELMVSGEMLARMNQAIEKLPPRCKMIFKLIREDNLKYKEVAEILNISINTIDVQMAIAVKRICEALNIQKTAKSRTSIWKFKV